MSNGKFPPAMSRILRRFAKCEDGGVLVENIIWIPVFLSLFAMIADASIMFMNHARVKKVLQEGSREMAIGQLEECSDLVTWLEANVRPFAPSATATCAENYLGKAAVSLATVTVRSDEIDLTGTAGYFGGINFRISMVYNLEIG